MLLAYFFNVLFAVSLTVTVLAIMNDSIILEQVANSFNISVLKTEAVNGQDLTWFNSMEHVSQDSSFVLNALTSQLCENTESSFKENRGLLARYSFEQFLKKVCLKDSDLNLKDLYDWGTRLVRILLIEEKHIYLFQLIMSYPKYVGVILSKTKSIGFAKFFGFIKTLPENELEQFLQLVHTNFCGPDKTLVYTELFNGFFPHKYFLGAMLMNNPAHLHFLFIERLEAIDNAHNKMELIGYFEEALNYLQQNQTLSDHLCFTDNISVSVENFPTMFQEILRTVELHLNFIKLGPNVTLADLGITDLSQISNELKLELIWKSIRLGRVNITTELITFVTLPFEFIKDKLKNCFYEQKRKFSPHLLPFVFNAWNLFYPEAKSGFWAHDSLDFWNHDSPLFHVVFISSKLSKINIFDTTKTSVTFDIDAEQVALGAPATFSFIEYGAMRSSFSFLVFSQCKFASSDVLMKFIHEIELNRPDILSYLLFSPVEINAHNLKLIMSSTEIEEHVERLDLIFNLSNPEDIDEISKLPDLSCLCRNINVILDEDIIANFTDTELQINNLAFLTGSPIPFLLLNSVFESTRIDVDESVYFKCRRVLDICANGPDWRTLREITFPIVRKLLVQDHPHLRSLFN